MFYYIFDTNVLLLYLLNFTLGEDATNNRFIKNSLKYFRALESLYLLNKAVFYVPSIILAETKKHLIENFVEKKGDIPKFRRLASELVKLIEFKYTEGKIDYNVFFNVELNRHHIIMFSKVCELERLTKPTKVTIKDDDGEEKVIEKTLSFADMLLLATAAELKHIHKEEVFLLSNDDRVRLIARLDPKMFPAPICLGNDPIPRRIKKIIEHE